MERYEITKSLLSSYDYMFECFESVQDDAKEAFLSALTRVKEPPNENMVNGLLFEDEVYKVAHGKQEKAHDKWQKGIELVAHEIMGAPVQIKLFRDFSVCGMDFRCVGVLDALQKGIIYDVKYLNKSFGSVDVYGKYLHSPQHSAYFFLVPEAKEFRYLVSDGQDLYTEVYYPKDIKPFPEITEEFIEGIKEMGLLEVYKEHWKIE